jgi:hypothetical protein
LDEGVAGFDDRRLLTYPAVHSVVSPEQDRYLRRRAAVVTIPARVLALAAAVVTWYWLGFPYSLVPGQPAFSPVGAGPILLLSAVIAVIPGIPFMLLVAVIREMNHRSIRRMGTSARLTFDDAGMCIQSPATVVRLPWSDLPQLRLQRLTGQVCTSIRNWESSGRQFLFVRSRPGELSETITSLSRGRTTVQVLELFPLLAVAKKALRPRRGPRPEGGRHAPRASRSREIDS